MGFKGDVTVKVRYTWEKNENTNWAIDNLTPYVPTPDTTESDGRQPLAVPGGVQSELLDANHRAVDGGQMVANRQTRSKR